MSGGWRWAALAGLALAGCPKDEPPPPEDRLLQKLKAEKDRLDRGGSAPSPAHPAPLAEPNPLAARAALPDTPKALAVVGPADFACGKAACRVSAVETSHRVAGDKLSLTSDDYFVRVALRVQLAGGGPVDLGPAKLIAGANEYPIARDAQRLGGTRELARDLRPGEAIEMILYFEAPQAALAPGLKLAVGGEAVSLQ